MPLPTSRLLDKRWIGHRRHPFLPGLLRWYRGPDDVETGRFRKLGGRTRLRPAGTPKLASDLCFWSQMVDAKARTESDPVKYRNPVPSVALPPWLVNLPSIVSERKRPARQFISRYAEYCMLVRGGIIAPPPEVRPKRRDFQRLLREIFLAGWRAGPGLTPLFDPAWYLLVNTDVAAANANPAVHFLQWGVRELRDPSPLFSTAWYLKQVPEIVRSGSNPIVHYRAKGAAALIDPGPLFHARWYADRYQDSTISAGSPLEHFLIEGYRKGYDPNPWFSTRWYCDQYGGEMAHPNAIIDYLISGAGARRDPSDRFNTSFYMDRYPDVADAGLNPLVHFLSHGLDEGRRPLPADARQRRSPRLDAARIRAHPIDANAKKQGSAVASPRPETPLAASPRQDRDPPAQADHDRTVPSQTETWPEICALGTRLGHLGPDEDTFAALGDGSRRTVSTLKVFALLNSMDASDFVLKTQSAESVAIFGDEPEVPGIEQLDRAILGGAVPIEDAWMLGEGNLRLRLGSLGAGGAPQSHPLRFYQMDAATGLLSETGQAEATGAEPSFCDVPLSNPFFPILIVRSGTGQRLADAAILPFPSLCRGGVHYGELRALGEWPDYVAGLRRMSLSLVREFFGWSNAHHAIARLKVDLRGAIGTERIFAPALQDWLCGVLHVKPAFIEQGEGFSPDASLRSKLGALPRIADAVAAREAHGSADLTIPADSIPTIAALVSRRLQIPEQGERAIGGMIVGDDATNAPRSIVSFPPLGNSLLALQPAGAGLPFPVLSSSAGVPAEDYHRRASLPLAIRFPNTVGLDASAVLFPSAPTTNALVRSLDQSERSGIAIDAIVNLEASYDALALYLTSIANQTIADRVNVLAITPAELSGLERIKQLLAEKFPARHVIVEAGGPPSARLNRAAERATGSHVLFAEDSVYLHDPRTLETLCLLATAERTASASCVLVREKLQGKNGVVQFHSGGLFPVGVSLAHSPHLIFREIETSVAIPSATYPVIANSFRLVLVRKAAWRTVGGLDAAAFPAANYDLDFGLRAAGAGLVHLCTAAVAASSFGDAVIRDRVDVLSLAYLAQQQWWDLLEASTIIRELA